MRRELTKRDEKRGREGEANGGTSVLPCITSQVTKRGEEIKDESQCFLRPGPQAHGPLPKEDTLALVQEGSTVRDPSLPRVRVPCAT